MVLAALVPVFAVKTAFARRSCRRKTRHLYAVVLSNTDESQGFIKVLVDSHDYLAYMARLAQRIPVLAGEDA